MNFNKMGGFFLLGSVLPKGAKNSGWRQSSFDGLKPKIFDMGLAPRFHMSSKVVISPYRYFLNPEKPAIFDFNHKCQKSEKTVDCVANFIYPYRICNIAIFVFLLIYQKIIIC